MSDYYITPRARADLLEIAAERSKHSRRSAARQIRRLRDVCQNILARHPEVGQACDELAPGLRCFSVDNYAIFFRRKTKVQIVRFLYGGRDFESLFRNEE